MRSFVVLTILILISFFSTAFGQPLSSIEEVQRMLKDATSGSILVYRPTPREETLAVLTDAPSSDRRQSMEFRPARSNKSILWNDVGVYSRNAATIVDVITPDKPEWAD